MKKVWIFLILTFFIVSCARSRPAPAINDLPTPTPLTAVEIATPTPSPTLARTPQQPTPPPTATPTMQPTAVPFPTYSGAPLNAGSIGIQIHLRDEEIDWLFEHLTALNVGWVKVQVSWKLYEPEPGMYHTERFAELDAFIAQANAENIQVMLGISKAPEWSRPTTEMDGPPSDFALFETFTAYVANRYQGQVGAYELWNEPNLQREWNGSSLSAADFVTLMEFGARGIRQADPNSVVISGAPATTGINDGVTAVDDRVYLQQMLASGVGNIVDAIGAHPYGAANPPDSRLASPSTVTTSHNNHPSFFFLDTLNDYEALLNQAGVNKPIWVTEFGWGSFENIAPDVPAGVEFMAQTNEWQQAEYIVQAYELGQSRDVVGPMILWNLNFAPLLGVDFSESGYSILRTDGAPRLSYLTLQDALSEAE
ncbi:MAG: cellulase family glycosylhydrolase [Chloroflexota bacterium]